MYLHHTRALISKFSPFLFSTTAFILSVSLLTSGIIVTNSSIFQAEGASPQQALLAKSLDTLPPETRQSLLANSSLSVATSYLEPFQNFAEGSTGTSNVTTGPRQDVIVYYDFHLVRVDADNQSHELLMLKFADNTSRTLEGSSIDYNVELNGTEFNFQGNGNTLTGVDLKIIRSLPLTETSIYPQNYSMAIDILNINDTAVSEKTGPFNVQIAG